MVEEIQNRMKILLDQTEKNIMQSYPNYKAYHDRKAKAAPLETTDYCYILNQRLIHRRQKYHSENSDAVVHIK